MVENDSIPKRNALFARQALSRLIAGGCAGVVISPGSRHTPLVMAVAQAGVPTEVVLDERSAGFFALGWAKAARAPIALMCTSGTAGANYFPAVVEAWETGVPLVMITTDRPPEHQGIGAPQTTAQDEFYLGHVKGRFTIGAADDDSALAELEELSGLLGTACAGKPGPVHLNVGFREPLWEAVPTPVDQEVPIQPARETGTTPCSTVDLPDVERGLLVVGPIQEAHPDSREAVAALAALARQRGWPVIADIASGLRQDGPENAGVVHHADLFLRSAATREALEPEVVLHVGRMPTSKTLFTWLQNLEDNGADILHLSTDGQPHSLGRAPHIVETSWGQLITSCQAAGSDTRPAGLWLQQWNQAECVTTSVVEVELESAGLWEGAVARVVGRMPAGSTLVLGSGMPIRDADNYIARLAPETTCLVNRGVNGIDGLIATAAGVARHNPDSPVRLLLGDQSFLHDVGSLANAAICPNLEIVVINNSGSGIFEFLPISQAGEPFEKYFIAPQPTDIQAAAAAYGIRASRYESLNDLTEWRDAPQKGPRIAEIMVERPHNVYIHSQISAAVIGRLDQEFHLETTDGERANVGRRGVESG